MPRPNGSPRRPRSRLLRRVAPLGAILLLALMIAVTAPGPRAPAAPVPVTVTTTPIPALDPSDPGRSRFGDLVFLGGLVLTPSDPALAGISGLVIAPDGGDFLAVSDFGTWIGGTIRADAGGRPTGVDNVRISSLTGADGRRIPGKVQADAEALARRSLPGGRTQYIVAIEAGARFLVYPGPDPMTARPVVRPVPAAVKGLPANNRIESLAVMPAGPFAGQLLAFAEGNDDSGDRIPGWIIGDKTVRDLALARSDGYSATDIAFLPDGDLLLLERRFGYLSWFGARLRRIPAASIRPGGLLDGPVLWEAGSRLEIDNMEALAVHRTADGQVIVTMLSDNNGMTRLQRTLLLRFRLTGPGAP